MLIDNPNNPIQATEFVRDSRLKVSQKCAVSIPNNPLTDSNMSLDDLKITEIRLKVCQPLVML